MKLNPKIKPVKKAQSKKQSFFNLCKNGLAFASGKRLCLFLLVRKAKLFNQVRKLCFLYLAFASGKRLCQKSEAFSTSKKAPAEKASLSHRLKKLRFFRPLSFTCLFLHVRKAKLFNQVRKLCFLYLAVLSQAFSTGQKALLSLPASAGPATAGC